MAKNKEKKSSNNLDLFLGANFKWVLVFLVIIILVLGYFIILQEPISRLKDSYNQKLPALVKIVKILEERKVFLSQNLNTGLSFTPSEEHLLSSALPGSFDFSSILIQIASLVKEFNFMVNNVVISEVKEAAPAALPEEGLAADADTGIIAKSAVQADALGLKKVNIDLEVSGGNYDDFKRLIEALESSRMIFDVKAVNFSGSESYKLNLVTYYYL